MKNYYSQSVPKKRGHRKVRCSIYGFRLVKVYSKFKKYPKKVFILKDFQDCGLSHCDRHYLNILISMGLIEPAEATHYNNKSVKAYQLNKIVKIK